jgi:hypothetical protein
MIESKKRSILKTLSYRAILTIVLAAITYAFTGNLVQTSDNHNVVGYGYYRLLFA